MNYNPDHLPLTKYLFFTGKGGVGKTSVACATAVRLADRGKKVLLVSTDPASNLQDVFDTKLNGIGIPIQGLENLLVANLDPIEAAAVYKESVVGPYRGKLPDSVIQNMEEQLSGSCTVEIAAFNEFSNFLTDDAISSEYDFILFDTAPTGHTLRMLQLPSAWSGFIAESTHGASCLGQLSGLEERKEVYQKAVQTLADPDETTLLLVTRPEETPLKEAERASKELYDLGVKNQKLILNGLLLEHSDAVTGKIYDKQQKALQDIPDDLKQLTQFDIPLRAYNITGLEALRKFLTEDDLQMDSLDLEVSDIPSLKEVLNELDSKGKRIIFTMGKGGVGKTTIAAALAQGLVERGKKVHLATTDPAAHLKYVISRNDLLTMSHIDEKEELKKYRKEVLDQARETMSEEDIAYVEEDLRSPCTQEIAVFRAFAEIVDKADDEIVIIDTAPTGHTLLLLDSSESYHKEVERTQGGTIPDSVRKLLPRLRSDETEVLLVTLPEATPVFEAMRLEEDLRRANINVKWWIINSSLYSSNTNSAFLRAKASHEAKWIHQISEHSNGLFTVIPWISENIKGENLKKLYSKMN